MGTVSKRHKLRHPMQEHCFEASLAGTGSNANKLKLRTYLCLSILTVSSLLLQPATTFACNFGNQATTGCVKNVKFIGGRRLPAGEPVQIKYARRLLTYDKKGLKLFERCPEH
jgi:hypothetical protein